MSSSLAVSVVTAAWTLDAPDEVWLRRIVEASAPLLDVGLGVHGMLLELESAQGPVHTPVMVGGTADWKARWLDDWWHSVVRHHPPAAHLAATAAGPVALGSTTNAQFLASMSVWQEYARRLTRAGYFPSGYTALTEPNAAIVERYSKLYPETLYVGGLDKPGQAVVLCVNLPSVPAEAMPDAQRQVWARLAAHLGAAFRLKRALAQRPALCATEAVLEPSGKLVHAEGRATPKAVRAGLRDAVVDLDKARAAKSRLSEFERVERWRALTQGRWSLLDSFERDGRRYVVARPNAPTPEATGLLTLRERQVLDFLAAGHANKLIAYELGISTSSVATHLARAAKKLGATSTAQLIRLARGTAAVSPEP